MTIRLRHAFPTILSAGMFVYLLSAQAAPSAPQTLVLKAAEVDVSVPLATGQAHAPLSIHRHFANPALLGQLKADMAAAAKPKPRRRRPTPAPRRTPTPTPTPTRTPTPTPTPTPSGSPVPISSGVTTAVPVVSFEGMNLYGGGGAVPPDTQVAAGATFVLEAVNSLGAVYSMGGRDPGQSEHDSLYD
jgi:hypothetical protein